MITNQLLVITFSYSLLANMYYTNGLFLNTTVMLHIEKHQAYAIISYIVFILLLLNDNLEQEELIRRSGVLLLFLLLILFYKLFSFLSSMSLMGSLASDSGNYKAGPFAFLFWVFYLFAAYHLVLK